MKKASVYTRSGDKGLTGLVGGTRISKSDSRINLYGEVDELNSHLGVALAFLDESFDQSFYIRIQSALFDLGSNLACEVENREKYKLPQITAAFITEIEKEIDKMDESLEKMTHFILPGGDKAASYFHVCRTVARRIEREMVAFNLKHPGDLSEESMHFINRLSDYFFICSRFINHSKNINETKWIPNK